MKELFFDEKFSAVIFLNGLVPDKSFFDMMPDIPIICADGAAQKISNLANKIDFIVGDFDSFDSMTSASCFNSSELIKIDEQETNDFEKCLKFALDKSYNNILICGFHGGELDHTLNNWSVFKRFASIMNLCVYDANRYGISVNHSFKANFNLNENISIIPQPEIKLITTGLKWNLNNEALALGIREGARNRVISHTQTFEIIDGSAFLFFEQRLFNAPCFK